MCTATGAESVVTMSLCLFEYGCVCMLYHRYYADKRVLQVLSFIAAEYVFTFIIV